MGNLRPSLSWWGATPQVSVGGGVHPRCSGDGEEIFYIAGNAMMAVPVATEPNFNLGTPKELFCGDDLGTDLLALVDRNMTLYDVSRDGERFVVVRGAGHDTSTIVFVEQWFAQHQN